MCKAFVAPIIAWLKAKISARETPTRIGSSLKRMGVVGQEESISCQIGFKNEASFEGSSYGQLR